MSLTTLRQPLSSLAALPLTRPSLLPRNAALPLRRSPSTSPLLVRHATTKSKRVAAQVKNDLEKELEGQKLMLQRARRGNPAGDLNLSNIPVLELEIDSPRPFWSRFWGLKKFYKTKDEEYEKARHFRDEQTLGSLSELLVRGAFEQDKVSNTLKTWPSFRAITLMISKTRPIRRTLDMLKEMYYERMRINASGTLGNASYIMIDQALAETQAIIKQRTEKREWQLIAENSEPKLVWARMNLVDPQTMACAAQLALQFDTKQALIVHRAKGKPTRRIVPVQETIVFERLIGTTTTDTTRWRLKGRLLPPGQTLVPGEKPPLGVLTRE